MSECEERMNVATVDICPCGTVMHLLQADDYGAAGSDSGICCMDCGNEQFVTVQELQAELDKHRWKKQIPNEAGCWLRINAVGRPEMSVVFKDSHLDNKLSIYWGWSPQSKQLIENIKDKLAAFYWYGPIILPEQEGGE